MLVTGYLYIDKESGRDKRFGELPVIPLGKIKYIDF